jgi:antitoxin (DNA-binding transcriptional repressor) of toxin-antitoxin stability system
MQVTVAELTADVGKYIKLSKKEDVVIFERGKPTATLVSADNKKTNDIKETNDISEIFGIARGTLPPEYDDPNYDPYYKELLGKAIDERYGR